MVRRSEGSILYKHRNKITTCYEKHGTGMDHETEKESMKIKITETLES